MTVMVVFAVPGRVAEADFPDADAGELIVHKHCEPSTMTGTFDLTVDFSFANPVTEDPPDPEIEEDEFFDIDFQLSCGDGLSTGPDDGDTIVFTTAAGGGLDDVIAWYTEYGAEAGAATAVIREDAPFGITATFQDSLQADCNFDTADIGTLADFGIWCTVTNTLDVEGRPFLEVNKVFDGDPTTEFTFLVESETAGGSCLVVIDGAATVVADGETFTITPEDVAAVYCTAATVTEQTGEGFTLTGLVCDDGPPNVQPDPAAGSVFFRLGTEGDASPCTWTNTAEVTDDDPALPNIAVTKVCFPEDIDATFEITVADVTEDAGCGDTVTAVDVEPGTYEVSEDTQPEGVVTVIACGDGDPVTGTSTEVTIPAEDAVDVECVIINAFGEDALEELICSCTCCGDEIDIDINNGNNNTIGIDNSNANNNANNNDNDNLNDNENKNENDNKNENTQDQINTQDQSNENSQSNNITSSPEVNIDFDE
jgi:hypothetical protein